MGGALDRFKPSWIDVEEAGARRRLSEFANAQPLDRLPFLAGLEQPSLGARSRFLEIRRRGRLAAVAVVVDPEVFGLRSVPIEIVVPGGAAAAIEVPERPCVAYAGERAWSELERAGGKLLVEELQMVRFQSPLPDADPRVVPVCDHDEVSASISRVHFEAGPYVGIRDERGRLASVGGVQVASERIAQLGGIWTREDRRREGLARAVVGELVRILEAGGRTVALHVGVDNPPAIELYASLGFRGRRRVRLYRFD